MNASGRWVSQFVKQMDCVKCHKKGNLTLYFFNGKRVDPNSYTLEQLHSLIDRMDTWCPSCPVKVNTRVAGSGRRTYKDEVVRITDVVCKLEKGSRYDEYVLDNGTAITKANLLAKVKDRPCALCGESYPAPIMEFHHLEDDKLSSVSSMVRKFCTVNQMIAEIEKCVLLCANCHRYVTYGLKQPPKEKIVLDENFWSSVS